MEKNLFYENPNFRLVLENNPGEYSLQIKNFDQNVSLPRGTLENIATVNKSRGIEIIQDLVPYGFSEQVFFKKTNLSYNLILEFLNEAYQKEKKEIESFRQNLRE